METTARPPARQGSIRTDWTVTEVAGLFALPLHDLLYQAHQLHRTYFDPAEVQISTLMSIKTGGCPEDCGYCPQSVHFNTGLTPEALVPLAAVVEAARAARERGATRFCMGAAYRNPRPGQLAKITEMVRAVRGLGLETCATLGMLTREQAEALRDAGLDYYNHNLESVPVNQLVQVAGTALDGQSTVDPITFVRVIAVARILMPKSRIRLSAGRTDMSDELQALCFFAGANSIFYGEQLLTTPNPATDRDLDLLARLGLRPAAPPAPA